LTIASFIAAALIIAAAAVLRELLRRGAETGKAVENEELLNRLRIELKRAKRFQYSVALVALDFAGSFSFKSVSKAFDQVLPHQAIKQELREYDLIIKLNPHLLFIVLPFQSEAVIQSALENRLSKIAAEGKWKNYKFALAVFPTDGTEAEELRNSCLRKLDKAVFK